MSIKFRVWDKERKTFDCSENYYALNLDGDVLEVESGLDYDLDSVTLLGNNFVVQQFTGLKDKNGVKIYEGDIVICPEGETDPEMGFDPNFLAGVCWDFNYLSWVLYDNEVGLIEMLFEYKDDLEVLGNIYENPELLDE